MLLQLNSREALDSNILRMVEQLPDGSDWLDSGFGVGARGSGIRLESPSPRSERRSPGAPNPRAGPVPPTSE